MNYEIGNGIIFCPKCGKENTVKSNFCLGCGNNLSIKKTKTVWLYLLSILIFIGTGLLLYIGISAFIFAFSYINMEVNIATFHDSKGDLSMVYKSKEGLSMVYKEMVYGGGSFSTDRQGNIVGYHKYKVIYSKYAIALIITGIIMLTGSILFLMGSYGLWQNVPGTKKLILLSSCLVIIFGSIAMWVVKVPVFVIATPLEDIVSFNVILGKLGEELFIDASILPIIIWSLIFVCTALYFRKVKGIIPDNVIQG